MQHTGEKQQYANSSLLGFGQTSSKSCKCYELPPGAHVIGNTLCRLRRRQRRIGTDSFSLLVCSIKTAQKEQVVLQSRCTCSPSSATSTAQLNCKNAVALHDPCAIFLVSCGCTQHSERIAVAMKRWIPPQRRDLAPHAIATGEGRGTVHAKSREQCNHPLLCSTAALRPRVDEAKNIEGRYLHLEVLADPERLRRVCDAQRTLQQSGGSCHVNMISIQLHGSHHSLNLTFQP